MAKATKVETTTKSEQETGDPNPVHGHEESVTKETSIDTDDEDMPKDEDIEEDFEIEEDEESDPETE